MVFSVMIDDDRNYISLFFCTFSVLFFKSWLGLVSFTFFFVPFSCLCWLPMCFPGYISPTSQIVFPPYVIAYPFSFRLTPMIDRFGLPLSNSVCSLSVWLPETVCFFVYDLLPLPGLKVQRYHFHCSWGHIHPAFTDDVSGNLVTALHTVLSSDY